MIPQGDLNPAGKLYIISRADLPRGLAAVQACHAAFQFAVEHANLMRAWHTGSNCLVLLSVPDELALLDWRDRATAAGLPVSTMVEPDIGDEHTAFAVAPSDLALFSELPLTGREVT